MRIEFATIRETPKRVTWKEWQIKHGQFLVTALFGPNKFPNATITFYDDTENVYVKKSLKIEKARELFQHFKNFIGDIYIDLYHKDNKWHMDLVFKENPESEYIYNLEGKNIIRRHKSKITQNLEDIPF